MQTSRRRFNHNWNVPVTDANQSPTRAVLITSGKFHTRLYMRSFNQADTNQSPPWMTQPSPSPVNDANYGFNHKWKIPRPADANQSPPQMTQPSRRRGERGLVPHIIGGT